MVEDKMKESKLSQVNCTNLEYVKKMVESELSLKNCTNLKFVYHKRKRIEPNKLYKLTICR